MFSNGTEYMIFLDEYCYKCANYVDYTEATKEDPCCPIEEQLSLCSITGAKSDWPKELQRVTGLYYECTQFEERKEDE